MLVSGGTIVTGDGRTMIPVGHVLVRDGLVASVGAGPGVAAENERVIDASKRLVMPGIVNTHAHGCVVGPLHPVAQPALPEDEVRAQLDRHLRAGETTVLCVCGFCLERETAATRDHPVRVRLATSHTPANFRASDIVDGRGLTVDHRAAGVERRLAEGAVAIGEIGAGHSLGGGGQDYHFIPQAIRRATGVTPRADQARALKWAILGKRLSPDAFDAQRTAECLHEIGLAEKLSVEEARALVQGSVMPSLQVALEGFEEAARLSASTGARAILHTSPVSVGVIERLARQHPRSRLVAAHANQSDFTPDEAIGWARRLRDLGVLIDISTWDSPGRAIQAKPDNFVAMLAAKVVDTISTDFAGGEWEPVIAGLAMAVRAGAVRVDEAVALATGQPAGFFPALAEGRGLLVPGSVADIVLTDPADLARVSTVIAGGEVVVRDGEIVRRPGVGAGRAVR